MVVERSLNTLNATIADTRSRVAALEKRKAGGAGIKIHVGPDYKGDGPHLLVPAIPNPQVLINHAVRPDPITGVTLYKQAGYNTPVFKYNFDTETWAEYEHGMPNHPNFNNTFNVAFNGWAGWANNYVFNFRTKKSYKTNFPSASLRTLAQGRYALFEGGYGNPHLFDTVDPQKRGNEYIALSSEYSYSRSFGVGTVYGYNRLGRNGKNYFTLSVIAGGIPVTVAEWEWTADHERKYNFDRGQLTAQGNLLIPKKQVPSGQNEYDLLAGVDGRFLGSPPGRQSPILNGYSATGQPPVVYDPQFSNPFTLPTGYIQTRSPWKQGFITTAGTLTIFYNLDGSLNRTVPTGVSVLVDFDV